jgi:hypothetical protein
MKSWRQNPEETSTGTGRLVPLQNKKGGSLIPLFSNPEDLYVLSNWCMGQMR